MPFSLAQSEPTRQIYCNRTLNLRSISAVGYDMDYTLVHYHVHDWEAVAFVHARERLVRRGWPVESITFQPDLVARGLVIDREKGNLLKANRFGYIKQAMHGTNMLSYDAVRKEYSRELVDLENPRFQFLNTLFSISEGTLFVQLVDLYDKGLIPRDEIPTYTQLAIDSRNALDMAHIEGVLKSEIMADPERFVDIDPDTALALLDQKMAGKKLMVITNSDYEYVTFMLEFAIGRFLPDNMSWKELFDLTVVSARKPAFFLSEQPILQVINEAGDLKPVIGPIKEGSIYWGGTASHVEKGLNLSGDEILYVGDHIYGDVSVSKRVSRWRTALILRELERELLSIEHRGPDQLQLSEWMKKKTTMEHQLSVMKLEKQRIQMNYPDVASTEDRLRLTELSQNAEELRARLVELDQLIAPLAKHDGEEVNRYWGYLMRAGNDKSHLTRQIERHADIYTSRVSNFLFYTPFMYFRARRGSMAHDPIEG